MKAKGVMGAHSHIPVADPEKLAAGSGAGSFSLALFPSSTTARQYARALRPQK